jgi:hypothetical protein
LFLIRFTDEPVPNVEPGEKARVGLLRLGSYEERFVSHFSVWTEPGYRDHWRDALVRALDKKPSALITDMWLPWQSSFITWWPMWLVGQKLVLQNHLFFFEQHGISDQHVNIEDLFKLIGLRRTHDDDVPLSEWNVSVAEVQRFLAK